MLKGSSKTPAPGHTMSMEPNTDPAASMAAASCDQDVTSHFWNTARALWEYEVVSSVEVDLDAVEATKSWASGRRLRSAMRTLQPLATRALAKQRLIP